MRLLLKAISKIIELVKGEALFVISLKKIIRPAIYFTLLGLIYKYFFKQEDVMNFLGNLSFIMMAYLMWSQNKQSEENIEKQLKIQIQNIEHQTDVSLFEKRKEVRSKFLNFYDEVRRAAFGHYLLGLNSTNKDFLYIIKQIPIKYQNLLVEVESLFGETIKQEVESFFKLVKPILEYTKFTKKDLIYQDNTLRNVIHDIMATEKDDNTVYLSKSPTTYLTHAERDEIANRMLEKMKIKESKR